MAGAQLVTWSLVKSDLLRNKELEHTDREILEKSSFEDARKELDEARKKHDEESKTLKGINKMKPVVDTLDTIGEFAEVFAKLDPHGVAPLVIGGFRFVIKLGSEYAGTFAEIEASVQLIHRKLDLVVSHNNREKFKKDRSERLDVALFKLFKAYWAFFDEVHSLYLEKSSTEGSKRRRFYHHIKDFAGKKIKNIKYNGEEVSTLCEQASEELDLESGKKDDQRDSRIDAELEAINSGLEKNDFEMYSQKFKEMLHPVMEVDNYFRETFKKRVPDTGEWILYDGIISKWMGPEKGSQPVLWLSAAPGFGKSSLTTLIVTKLKERQPTGVAYFSCSHERPARQKVQNILSTMVHQLLRRDKFTRKAHFDVNSTCVNAAQDYLPPDVDSLCEILESFADQLHGKSTILAIDALDECSWSDEAEKEFQKMFKTFDYLASRGWKFLLTSRPSPRCRKAMEKALSSRMTKTVITQEENSKDIDVVAPFRIHEMALAEECNWVSGFPDRASDVLISNANGLFKWVDLLLGKLESAVKDNEKAEYIINNLPSSDLRDIYYRALERVAGLPEDEQPVRQRVSHALTWMLRTYRPVRIGELHAALTIHPDITQTRVKIEDVRRELLDYLGDLIQIDKSSDELSFTHKTVRDFLLSEPRPSYNDGKFKPIPDNLSEIDHEILRVCLQYLCNEDRGFIDANVADDNSKNRFRNLLKAWPFWEYASIGWIYHADMVGQNDDTEKMTKEALDRFFKSDKDIFVLRWLQIFTFLRLERFPSAGGAYSLMHYALLDSPRNRGTLEKAISLYPDVIDHLGLADGGRFQRWEKFLEHWAHPCYTPVTLASVFNYSEALEHFLENGDPAHNHGRPRFSSVSFAAFGDSEAALNVLLSPKYEGWFPARKSPLPSRQDGLSVLFDAIFSPRHILREPGRFPAAIKLLKDGAHLGPGIEEIFMDCTEDSPGAGELAEAMLRRHPGALSWMNPDVGLVMNYCAFVGHSNIFSTLLKHQKEAIDEKHLSPWYSCGRGGGTMCTIHYVACNNDAAAARALLHGNVGSGFLHLQASYNQWTAFHFAAQQRLETKKRRRERDRSEWNLIKQDIGLKDHVMHVLIDKFPNPDIKDDSGNLPIHLAAYVGDTGIIDLLTRLGYDWDIPNAKGTGKTPLTIAIETGNISAVKIMLDRRANPDLVPDDTPNLEHMMFHNEKLRKAKEGKRQPCLTLQLVKAFRSRLPQKFLPIPLIAAILDYADFHESTKMERKDPDINVTGQLTGDMPYINSAPIRGGNSMPVRKLTLTSHSKRQQLAGDDDWERTWCWMRTDKIEKKTGHTVPWMPEGIWRWNYKPWKTESRTYSVDVENERRNLTNLKHGDRVVITPVTLFPAWFAYVEWARIEMRVAMLRNKLRFGRDSMDGANELEKIWGNPKQAVPEAVVNALRKYRDGHIVPGFFEQSAIEQRYRSPKTDDQERQDVLALLKLCQKNI